MGGGGSIELSEVELLVLWAAGGENTLATAYGFVQLLREFDEREALLELTQSVLLRLYDLGYVRFVRVAPDVGYRGGRDGMPAMSRAELVVQFDRGLVEAELPNVVPLVERDEVFIDPTEAGRKVLASVPRDSIPRVSGHVRRPWLGNDI